MKIWLAILVLVALGKTVTGMDDEKYVESKGRRNRNRLKQIGKLQGANRVKAENLEMASFPLKDRITWEREQLLTTEGNVDGTAENSHYPAGDKDNWYRPVGPIPTLTAQRQRECLADAEEDMAELTSIVQEIKAMNLTLAEGTAAYKHSHMFKKTHPKSLQMAQAGIKMEYAAKSIKKMKNLDNEECSFEMSLMDTPILRAAVCDGVVEREEPPNCNQFLNFRTIDGTCNNLDFPLWGATFTAFNRIAPYAYGDGIGSPRRAANGQELPSTRVVSTQVNMEPNHPSFHLSLLHMTYGQFLDHDLTFAPINKGPDGKELDCCPSSTNTVIHPECLPIPIPSDDPFYAQCAKTCMNFARSSPGVRCTPGPREQLNEKTSYMDGSHIYGISQEMANGLRSNTSGKLLHEFRNGIELLPFDRNSECNRKEKEELDQFCFRAGDHRVNEQVLLTIMHMTWSKHHNIVAKKLKELHPTKNDEWLYQNARKIVVAQWQHITYNEYLTPVFGKTLMDVNNLTPLQNNQQQNVYDPTVPPAITAEFATAAFRYGHTQIKSIIKFTKANADESCKELNSVLESPFDMYTKGAIEDLLRGEVSQPAGEFDSFFTRQITGELFKGNETCGMDLVALNMQRGRDHGVSGYNRVRQACGLSRATDFNDLSVHIKKDIIIKLKKVYTSVDDIDLFIGGLAERPMEGALVGPTFACIILDQFVRLKVSDRYFYETTDPNTGFTPLQMKEIHKTTFARILCDVFPELKEIQKWPLLNPSDDNPYINCASRKIKKINYNKWADLN